MKKSEALILHIHLENRLIYIFEYENVTGKLRII